MGLVGAFFAFLGTEMVWIAARQTDWTLVALGAILVLAGGAAVLLNRRAPEE
jgi:hypothetical protein